MSEINDIIDINNSIRNKTEDNQELSERIDIWQHNPDDIELNTIILSLCPNSNNKSSVYCPDHYFDDLEIDTVIFPQINKTQTLVGECTLKNYLHTPSNNKDVLKEIQNKINSLPTLEHELDELAKLESDFFWFWKNKDEHLKTLEEMIYFNNFEEGAWGSGIDYWLNTCSSLLGASNVYKIFLNPTLTIAIPLLSILLPFLILRYYNIRLPWKMLGKLLFSQFTSVWQVPNKYNITSIISASVWIFFYFQNIYYAISQSYYTNKIINIIHQKLNNASQFISHYINLIECTNFLENNLGEWKNVILDIGEPGLFTNKGRVLVAYQKFKKLITTDENCISDINEMIQNIGFVDMCTSIKKLTYCGYHFVEYLDSSRPKLIIDNLIPIDNNNKVANNLDLSKCRHILITGGNAMGKSTIIKSLGVAVLLGQTLGIANGQLRFSLFDNLNSFINIADVTGKTSLFETEALRIKEHMDLVNNGRSTFLLMDELFSSTNYVEGLSISWAILRELIYKNNSLAVISTHYIDLSNLESLTKKKVKHGGVKYYLKNYKMDKGFVLRRGTSDLKMAIHLFKKFGFSNNILKVARKISEKTNSRILRSDSN